jgi:hypothetical protein
MSSPTPVSAPRPVHPRHRKLRAQLLAEIDPSGTLPADERELRLAEAKRRHFRSLAARYLDAEGDELRALIKVVALAIARQARRMAREAEGGGGDALD